ncbi:MAG: NfeD family protein [Ruminococcus sp.]|jgi:membrane protein implicated in regulation of membrane protease activity|nr:NfeD family protein [Ruminococcus sp.]
MDVMIWAVAFVLFLAAEIATVQLVSIWFAVGALVTLVFSALFDLNLLAQLGIFILSSGIFLVITLPYLRKRQKAGHIDTNAGLDVGKSAKVIEEINSDKGTGRVTLNGVDWSAVPVPEDAVILKGSIVRVEKVDGARLAVSLKSGPEE